MYEFLRFRKPGFRKLWFMKLGASGTTRFRQLALCNSTAATQETYFTRFRKRDSGNQAILRTTRFGKLGSGVAKVGVGGWGGGDNVHVTGAFRTVCAPYITASVVSTLSIPRFPNLRFPASESEFVSFWNPRVFIFRSSADQKTLCGQGKRGECFKCRPDALRGHLGSMSTSHEESQNKP